MAERRTGRNAFATARQAFRTGDFESAERTLRALVQAEPKNSDARLLLGQCYLKQDKFDAAIAAFAALLSLQNENVEALLQLGILYRLKGRLGDAANALQRGIQLDPKRADLHYHLGSVHRQGGRLEEARTCFERAIKLDPREALSYNALGSVLCKLGRRDEAIQVFWRGLQSDPNNPALHYAFGLVLESSGRLEEAIAEYESAVRIRPSWKDAVNVLGTAYRKSGNPAKAVEILARLVSLDPRNPGALTELGLAYDELGKKDEAVAYLRKAIESDPAHAQASLGLERILENSGALTDALEELRRLSLVLPGNADVGVHLGRLLFTLGHYPEAAAALKAVVKRDASNIEALRALGTVYQKSGNARAAMECFKRILAVDPSALAFRLDLAELHKQAGDWKAAETELKAYLSQRPEDKAARLELGRVYALWGAHDHALQIFRQLERSGGGPEVLAELSALYQAMGDKEKAVQAIDALINLRGGRGRPEDIEDINESLKRYESAVKVYSKDVRAAWDRNLRILKNAFRLKEELERGEGAADARPEPAPVLEASSGPKPVEEEAEQVFLDEREEELAKEDDFYDGELGLSDGQDELLEDEEPAETLLRLGGGGSDADSKPMDRLLDGQELYGEQDTRRPAEQPQYPQGGGQERQPRREPEPPFYPEEPPEWLKEFGRLPRAAEPFRDASSPQYQPPPPPQYQQPAPPPYQQPFPPPYQQPAQYSPPPYQPFPGYHQPGYQGQPPYQSQPSYPPADRGPARPVDYDPSLKPNPPAEETPQMPSPDEIDLDMLDSLEEAILATDDEMEDIVPEGELVPEEAGPEEAAEEIFPLPEEGEGDTAVEAAASEPSGDETAESAAELADGEPSEPVDEAEELPEESEAEEEEAENVIPKFLPLESEIEEPVEIEEGEEDIFSEEGSEEEEVILNPEEAADAAIAELAAGAVPGTGSDAGPSTETTTARDPVIGPHTIKLLEYLKSLVRELPDAHRRPEPIAEAEQRIADVMSRLERTVAKSSAPLPGGPGDRADKALADSADSELQMYAEPPPSGPRAGKSGKGARDRHAPVSEMESIALSQGLQVSGKMARLLKFLKRDKE